MTGESHQGTDPYQADSAARIRAATGEVSFIDAAAGSGKTTTIIARIIHHLLLEGGDIERVAATTFTLAAAAQLRSKVRQTLEQILAWTDEKVSSERALGPESANGRDDSEIPATGVSKWEEPASGSAARSERFPSDPAAKLVCDLIDDPSLAQERCIDALNKLDRAPWGTLHSLALRLIAESLPELATPAGIRLREGHEQEHQDRTAAEQLHDQIWSESWWRDNVLVRRYGDETRPSGIGDVLSRSTVERLAIATSEQLVGQRHRRFRSESSEVAGATMGASVDAWLTTFARVRAEVLTRLDSPELAALLELPEDRSVTEILRAAAAAVPDALPPVEPTDGKRPLAPLCLMCSDLSDAEVFGRLLSHRIRVTGNVGEWTRCGGEAVLVPVSRKGGKVVDQLKDQVKRLQEALPGGDYLPGIHQVVDQALSNASDLHRHRTESGRLAFDDAVDLAASAVIADRFDLVVIDEVQDSDPLQHHLLDAFEVSGAEVIVVGDERQSIYQFRGATPGLFAARRDEAAAGRVARLTRTFRHHETLADALNVLFAVGIIDTGVAPPEAITKSLGGSTEIPVQVVVGSSGQDAKAGKAAEASSVIAEIQRIREQENCRFSDIAILMPTRAPLAALRAELRRAAVPFVVAAADLSWETDGARGLAAALEYQVTESRLALAALAQSPWLAVPLRDVALGLRNQEGPVASAAASVRTAGIPDGADAAAATRRVFDALQVDRLVQRVARAGRPDLAGQLLADIRFVLDQACDYAGQGGSGLAGFVAQITADRSDGADQRVKGSSAGDHQDAVTIMTVHSAKGLEYPHVLLVGLGNKPRPDKFGLLWPENPDEPGSRVVARLKRGLAAETPDLRLKEIDTKFGRREATESDRLLYVALTRASRTVTVLVRPSGSDEDGNAISAWWSGSGFTGMQSVLWNRLHALPGAPDDIDGPMELVPGRILLRAVLPPVAGPIGDGTQTAPWPDAPEPLAAPVVPTVIGSSHDMVAGWEPGTEPDDRIGNGSPAATARPESSPGGRAYGTAVHTAVQRFWLRGADPIGLSATRQMRGVVERLVHEPETVDAAVRAALAILRSSPLAKARATGTRIEFEWPVLARYQDLLRPGDVVGGGVIDILVFAPSGLQIYDIKTDRSGDRNRLARKYADQLLTYRRAVEAAGAGPVTRTALILANGEVVDVDGTGRSQREQ